MSRGYLMSHKRILIVDDNEDNRCILRYWLRMIEDFEILEATHGQEALEVVLREPLDLIFMDLKMPVLDGWEATRCIRALEGPARDVLIVALTAQAMLGDEERALAAGCDDFISKPIINPGIIRKKVERLLVNGRERGSVWVSGS
jgi:two-component system cell cycle response regulator DivK